MDMFTHMFTRRTIDEDSKKEKPLPPPTIHDTNITKLDLPYKPMKSPKKYKKK